MGIFFLPIIICDYKNLRPLEEDKEFSLMNFLSLSSEEKVT